MSNEERVYQDKYSPGSLYGCEGGVEVIWRPRLKKLKLDTEFLSRSFCLPQLLSLKHRIGRIPKGGDTGHAGADLFEHF